MAMQRFRSRIHLLPAKQSPRIVVLQRKRAKLFHVITIDTERNTVEEGSWFRGKLYAMRCDVSFDGKYMIYMAMGANGRVWQGLCRLPWLTTLAHVECDSTWFGGGYFSGERLLSTNGHWGIGKIDLHHKAQLALKPYASRFGGEDLGVVCERLERDGFKREGERWGEERVVSARTYRVEYEGGDGWLLRPSPKHPMLRARYAGYLTHGYTFAFTLDEHPELLEGASWACWDVSGCLWVARPGLVEKLTLHDLRHGRPSFSLDVEVLEPPAKVERVATSDPLLDGPTKRPAGRRSKQDTGRKP